MVSRSDSVAVSALRVAAGDDRSRYDGFAIALHWITAALVILQFALSQLWGFVPRETRHSMIVAHMSFGILLAVVIVVRLGWRLTPGHRVRPASTGIAEALAIAVHWLLYALLIAEAVLGFVLRWSGDEAMSFFGLPLPSPFEAWSKPAHHFVGELHEWNGWAIIVIACGHALAAVAHHWLLKDDVLWRMIPGARARAMTDRAPSPEQAADMGRL